MIASGIYCAVFIIACYKATRFRQIFIDFKVEIPMVTQVFLAISEVVWNDYVWVLLLPLSILWPWVLAKILPIPKTPESRRRIAARTRSLVVVMYLITLALIAYALFAPMILLIQSVAGPAKK